MGRRHYRAIVGRFRLIVVLIARIVRWWFGLTYVAAGAGAIVSAPIMIGLGNDGGFYMLLGGPIILVLGWVVHPWGLQRATSGGSLLPLAVVPFVLGTARLRRAARRQR